jgi:hypothetical protein
MRCVLVAALCAALGACAHARVESCGPDCRNVTATAVGQASISVTPEGAVAVQGGALSETFGALARTVAAIWAPVAALIPGGAPEPTP